MSVLGKDILPIKCGGCGSVVFINLGLYDPSSPAEDRCPYCDLSKYDSLAILVDVRTEGKDLQQKCEDLPAVLSRYADRMKLGKITL